MIKAEVIPREWGNSLGITLSQEVIKKAHIKKGKPIAIFIAEGNPNGLRETYGMLKGWKKSGQQIKDEMRALLHHDR